MLHTSAETTQPAASADICLRGYTQQLAGMEETVRTLLQNQDSLEGPKVDPLDLMKAYKDKLLEEMWKQQDSLEGPTATSVEMPTSPEAGGGSEENSKDSNPLLERLRALEAENSALSMENDNQRKQYERCLDEVANQVVQALLTQKDLKEECVKLRTRVFDLEQQNRILSVLFQQRVKMSTIPVSQEVQRNGKGGIPAGRWPSLLSLTCPRSSGSGSGSELSLSSACSEYSSGSHTWAEGRGSSKQCATSRDKRMSACSISSNHSAATGQTDLGWKEGHILKGLKCLQMCNSKEASSLPSVPHCKDCMTSNEGIYSLGVKPPLKPVMGMNGAKARSQSFGARYMDRPSFNRSGKVRTQIKTHSGSSLNSLSDVLPGSMSCSSSYHCPMNRSLLNNFLIEEGLAVPSHLGSSSERLQSLKQQREQARRLQIEQQFSSAFGEPVSEEPERQSTITTIEEKVMLGIEENLHKTHEQERSSEVKQKSGSTLASWFGFRKSKLPAPSKKTDPPKVKEDKREQKITSLLGGKQTKSDKKKDRRKGDGKESSVGRRESHDAVRACISMPCPGMSLNEIQGHTDIGDPKIQMVNLRADGENGSTVKSPNQDAVIGFGCKMRTLDSGIGTIPLPESCSFFSSILHLLPKSSSTPEQSFSPTSVPSSSKQATQTATRWIGTKEVDLYQIENTNHSEPTERTDTTSARHLVYEADC
ncbi:Nck-associated protein 5 [Larimichthys crocea]|uniref:Nck-associated protein 5 n=1 Tax=Larimichthys crocea TaxID=215358 RepID=A0A6G0J7I1_LARCR|nr:Nck-associated protein 5 [Larimichthys crocea]